MVNKRRIRPRNVRTYQGGPILLWMGRDHRVHDNWAFLAAQAMAEHNKVPLIVVFTLVPVYLEASWRQYSFMMQGLQEVEKELQKLSIPFLLPLGEPDQLIIDLVEQLKIGAVVNDFLPLKIINHWKQRVADTITVPMYEVDAHNVVPAWIASPKSEFGAYTLRPKLRKLWPEFLEDFPTAHKQKYQWEQTFQPVDWEQAYSSLRINTHVGPVDWLQSGSQAGRSMVKTFLENKLEGYATRRNLPGVDALSELSPYYHYGQIAPQRVALDVQASNAPEADKEAYLEELLVRRELSDNFCLYVENYASLKAAPNWARQSLEEHALDPREYTYSFEQFEKASTHDSLWNAAQMEMVKRGKMHGYMRMYWAKKILEWSATSEEAHSTAVTLNDRYFLDGRDPNGYANILWAIAGLHDRAWYERPIYGKIRYMNRNGAERKFDVQAYIDYVDKLPVAANSSINSKASA